MAHSHRPDPPGRDAFGRDAFGRDAAGGAPHADPPRSWAVERQRSHLQRCWQGDCDIDPMILRARLLRHQGSLPQATCVEQELLPLF